MARIVRVVGRHDACGEVEGEVEDVDEGVGMVRLMVWQGRG